MYFKDLEPCTYHRGALDAASWAVPLRAVGWLEQGEELAVGVVPATFVQRFERLLELTRSNLPHKTFRGLHTCSLCAATGRQVDELEASSANLIVPGRNEVFAAPGGLPHYVSEHSYLPPACFLEATSTCPDPGSPDYFEALKRANAGAEPPLMSYEQHLRLWHAETARWRAFKDALGIPVRGAPRAEVTKAARVAWPDRSFPDDVESIDLGDATIWFDNLGKVADVRPR